MSTSNLNIERALGDIVSQVQRVNQQIKEVSLFALKHQSASVAQQEVNDFEQWCAETDLLNDLPDRTPTFVRVKHGKTNSISLWALPSVEFLARAKLAHQNSVKPPRK